MLQWPYTYIARICYKCFIHFGRILQQMLHVAKYVINVYVAANASCCKCSMSRCGKWVQAEVVLVGTTVPAYAGSEAAVVACVP
jgi:hypothetical protein